MQANKGYAVVGIHGVDQTAMFNPYGETIVGYGKQTSAMNKRNNTAVKYGFKNAGEFSVWIHCQLELGYTSAQVAWKLGWERHAPAAYIRAFDMVKCIQEYDPRNKELQKEIRDFVAKGASNKKIAEMKQLEIPTVCLYIGDYNKALTRSFIVAQRRGYSKGELEVLITKMVLENHGFEHIARELKIDETSCKRYFMRCVRRHLKPEDLKEGQYASNCRH